MQFTTIKNVSGLQHCSISNPGMQPVGHRECSYRKFTEIPATKSTSLLPPPGKMPCLLFQDLLRDSSRTLVQLHLQQRLSAPLGPCPSFPSHRPLLLLFSEQYNFKHSVNEVSQRWWKCLALASNVDKINDPRSHGWWQSQKALGSQQQRLHSLYSRAVRQLRELRPGKDRVPNPSYQSSRAFLEIKSLVSFPQYSVKWRKDSIIKNWAQNRSNTADQHLFLESFKPDSLCVCRGLALQKCCLSSRECDGQDFQNGSSVMTLDEHLCLKRPWISLFLLWQKKKNPKNPFCGEYMALLLFRIA